VEGARDLIAHVAGLGAGGMLAAVVTPRFIPACTDAALEGLGALARETGARVQTHAAESDWEVAHVRGRTGLSDAEALDRFGLLGPRSVLAHGVFLDDADLGLLARRGAAVAHCALSNAYFAGAVFPLRAALEKGVRVGLGTDVSGGPDASMWSAMRMTVAASRMLASGVDPDLPPGERGRPGAAADWREAFHLATAGGAAALDLPVGTFRPGLRFDAVAVRDAAAVEGGPAALAAPEARLARLLHAAGREDIRAVYTDGVRRVPAPA
jgi:guanine deaminase